MDDAYQYVNHFPKLLIDFSALSAFDRLVSRDTPCSFGRLSQQLGCCVGSSTCIANTNAYAARFRRTGNKLDRCAFCVSQLICVISGAATISSSLSLEPTSRILSAEVSRCFQCQNSCMIKLWHERNTPLWLAAARICTRSGENSKGCCLASVRAEQDGYSRCVPSCCIPLTVIPQELRIYFATDILKCYE